ncbi:MAG: TetR/AcrR family transcriptional regulator [Clostridia bacterium]|nr:TetR/AcrR family transcriptional regulator [Clostridia bacterium]
MKQDETRRNLIDGTIHVIARDGLDKATTKMIGKETGINEAYIYRCFKSKEDMFSQAFASLDEELVIKTLQHVTVMELTELDFVHRCRLFFNAIWRFLLGNKDKCLAFIRYYYSPYFQQYSAESHTVRYKPLVERAKLLFREEANTWMILNHIFDVMLSFGVKVYNGAVPDDDDTEEHVFRLIYASVQQYFKQKEREAQ